MNNNTVFLFRWAVCAIFFLGVQSLKGQENLSFYHQKNNIEKLSFNPALFKDQHAAAYLGLMGVGVGAHSSFLYSDIIHKGTGALSDSLVLDIPNFRNTLEKQNHVSIGANTSVFHFVVHLNPKYEDDQAQSPNHYLGFRLRQRVIGGIHFDKNYVELLTQGNAPFYADDFQTGQMGVNVSAFTESSVSYGRQLSDRLWAGVSVKLLQGLYDITTQHFSLGLHGYEFDNYIDVNASAAINVSGPLRIGLNGDGFIDDIDLQKPNSINLFSNGNPGYAFDLGLVYELAENLFVSASVTDLGKIHWRTDVQQLTLDTQYRYEPINFSDSYDKDLENYQSPKSLFEDLSDEVKEAFVWSEENTRYDRNLPKRLYAGLQYQWGRGLDLGLAYLCQKIDSYATERLTASANVALGKTLMLSPTYTNINGNSLWGGAFGIQIGAMQLYAAFSDFAGINSPAHAYAPELQFGLSFRFDKPLLVKD